MLKKILFLIFIFNISMGEIDYKKELSALATIGDKKFNKEETADLVVIDFWASWCEPCKESFPYYDKKIKAQNKRILFISVNLDESVDKAEEFLKAYPIKHITLFDEKRRLMNLIGFDYIPFMVILDKNWKEKEKIKGFNEKTKKRVDKYF